MRIASFLRFPFLFRIAAAGMLASALGACASAPERPGPAQAPATAQADRVAEALLAADRAEQAGDGVALAAAIGVLDRLGAKPLDAAAGDPLPHWRSLADTGEPPLRGRPLGPGYRKGVIAPGQTERIEQLFLSGQRARIALTAPGQNRLNLTVDDAKQSSVCGAGARPLRCEWVPLFTQRYTIAIANPGTAAAEYYLAVE